MRRTLVAGMTICAAAGGLGVTTVSIATAASASGRPVTVKPRLGSPSSTFSVGFRAPDRTGKVGGQERYYVVSATGPSGGQGCVGQITRDAGASRAHARVRVSLTPGAGRWCSGTFRGSVTEQARPACAYREVCPLYIVLVKNVGRFSFTVKLASGRRDTQAPAFAGLRSATTCTPGPQRPGEMTRYHLSWRAAHDNVTPRAELVYDVFMATSPGKESFAQPNWTTAAGATQFTTPPLSANGSVYFVVRARDRAGNEDHNRVERAGVNPCL